MLQYSIFSEKEREVNVWVAFYDITQLVWDRVHQICLLLFVGVKKKLKLKKVARINESGIIVTHTKVLKRILESSVLLLSATLEGQLEHWSPSSDRRKAKPETQKVLQSVLHRKKEAVQFASAKRSGKEKYTSRVGLHWTLFKIMITLYKKKNLKRWFGPSLGKEQEKMTHLLVGLFQQSINIVNVIGHGFYRHGNNFDRFQKLTKICCIQYNWISKQDGV